MIHGVVISQKKQDADTWHQMHEPQKHHARERSHIQTAMSHVLIRKKWPEEANQWSLQKISGGLPWA